MIEHICGMDLFWEARGSGLPLVCLHGNGVDHRSIKSAMESVCRDRQGIQRIYFDLPGMGRSQTPAGGHRQIQGSDDMLAVVSRFIDAVLGPDQPFALVGYSYGTYLARGLVYQMPHRVLGMLLICPVVALGRKGRQLPEFKCCEQEDDFIGGLSVDAFQTIDGFMTIQTPAVWEQFQSSIQSALSLADPGLMHRLRNAEFSFPVDGAEQVFSQPVLVLTGRYDVVVGYKDVQKLAPSFSNARFQVLDRAGHLLHMEAPDLFASHTRQWLDQVQDIAIENFPC